jgi:hypothetical protein
MASSMTQTQRRIQRRRSTHRPAPTKAELGQSGFTDFIFSRSQESFAGGVLPERHRKNYDARGNIIFGPRPAELDAQRRAFLAGGQAA